MSQLAEIKNLAGYLTAFGKTLGRKAIHSLSPLHVPGRDPLPDFGYIPEHRQPFEAQAHLISGAVKGMTANGACFVIGEPGCGKTISAIVAVNEHAKRPRKRGGMGGKYRAIVVCPDHLITKWKNEIEDTIPGAVVHCWRPKGDEGSGVTLRHWSDFLNLMRLGYSETKVRAGEQPTDVHEASVSTGIGPYVNDKGELVDQPYKFEDCPVKPRPTSGKVVQHRLRWSKPVGPEWIIVGRDQIKRQSQTSGLGQPRRCFDRQVREWQPSHSVVTDRKPITDGYGDQVVVNGIVQTKPGIEKRMQCPRCGTIPTKKGVPLGPDALDKGDGKHCEAMILEEIGSPDGKCSGRDRLIGKDIPHEQRNAKEGQTVKHAGKQWRVRVCGEPLYQYTRKPYWWPPALLVQRKLRGIASYLVIDECFPGWTLVATIDGPRPICNVRPGDRVYSTDHLGNQCIKTVTRLIVRRQSSPLVTVIHDFGGPKHPYFQCTQNHRIYVRDSRSGRWIKKPGVELEEGDVLCLLCQGDPGHAYLSGDRNQSLRAVWTGDGDHDPHAESTLLFSEVLRVVITEENPEDLPGVQGGVRERASQESEVLFQELFAQGSLPGPRIPGEAGAALAEQDRDAASRGLCPDAAAQSRARDQAEARGGCGQAEGQEVRWNPGWQWLVDPATESSGRGYWIRHGVSHTDGQPVLEVRRGGPGETGDEASDRGGRPLARYPDAEEAGPDQGGDAQGAGVEDPADHQQGSRAGTRLHGGDHQDVGGDLLVYDLEVEDTHRYFANGVLVSNCHEQKAEDSEQSLAMGKILGNSQYALALTGTFIGGYASHLFPLLIRLAARDMTARNFEWGSMKEFIERYGCNDRIEITETVVENEGKKRGVRGGSQKRSTTKVTYKCRPGIMPTLFSEIVMPLAMFLKLDQFIDDLPGFEQRMIACELPAEIQESYNQLQLWLVEANRELIANGLPKLLGTMLWTLLSYPDFPWEWEYMFPYEGKEQTPKFWENGRPVFSDGAPEHAIGWWYVPKVWTRENYVGVCTPKNFDKSIILPKERELINLVKTNTEAGDQTWVYCEMTGKRDVMARLARLLEEDGLRVGVLRSGDVSPKERDVWIQRNGHLYDVMLSHPQLVSTGLDLFNLHHGNYNFNHLVFYQSGYNLFRLRQAERRAWRIGQPKDCTVTYLYYKGTSQATALALMGRKAQAAQTLEEGTISDEGLAAMGGDAGAQAALVKALGDFIDPAEIQRNWSRVSGRGGAKRKPRPVRPSAISLPVPDELYEEERIPPPGVPSPLDSLPIKAQIVGETMLKARNANSPDEALADFRAWLAEEAAKLEEKPAVKVFDPEPEPEPVQAVEDWRCPRCGGDKSCPSAGPGAACHKTRHQAEQEWRERDQPKPKRLEDYSRDQLAAIFDAMRAGTLKNDDWDW